MAGAKAHMIGGAFISKGDRNGPMDRERRRSKADPKLLQCLGPFMTAMRHGHEIGHGEMALAVARVWSGRDSGGIGRPHRSEEHTSELQSLMRNSYAVFR